MDWKDDEYEALLRQFQPRKPSAPSEMLSLGTRRPRLWVFAVAAVILLGVLSVALLRNLQGIHAYTVVEAADGGLYRVSGGQTLHAGEKIEMGDIVRTDGGVGTVLALADGSRVEMRAQSALSVERADDGVRIRLDKGGIIVTAAKQRSGHLYVQTKDVTVSVVGTVFLVNSDEAGSRVAVIQGEVRVQQGGTAKKLLPGEQTATNPLMESHPVTEEVSWSRQAEKHLALLRESTARDATTSSNAAPSRTRFEVASITPVPWPGAGPAGIALLQASVGPVRAGFVGCKGIDGDLTYAASGDFAYGPSSWIVGDGVPRGQCIGNMVSLRTLLSIAYDIPMGRISGGEDWPERYHIEANAQDLTSVTRDQLSQMLRTEVIDRFNVKAHRDTKEMQGYVLLVGKNGVKFKEATGDEESPRFQRSLDPPQPGPLKGNFRLRRLANYLSVGAAWPPIINKTDLPGLYDISLTLHMVLPTGRGGETSSGPLGPPEFDPPLAKALEDQLGLRLESAKVPVEYLVVDHIEKPSEK
jgi:uncharacterized protein (TIGR03435 family)